jgi:uncharacterized membrane-anchored protein
MIATLLKNRVVLALVIVALAQTGVLAAMVVDRVRLLQTGREITLPIVPVDPRDFFRGQYVRLGYDISRVPARLLEGPLPHRNSPFYVTLEKGQDGAWKPVKLTRKLVQETSAERIVLKARALHGRLFAGTGADAQHFVRYGIESYFVTEGQGPRLEKLAQEKKLSAVIAVDGGGNAAIKGVLVEGVLHGEPLF